MAEMRRSSRLLLLVATAGAAITTPAALLAGPRIAPVAAVCPMDQRERVIDADGERDHCVGRTAPKCATGAELRVDVEEKADLCVAAGSGGAEKGKAPKCSNGFRLQKVAGKDVCERSSPPVCPSGATLKVGQGEDQCHY
jgi:hypothetical protein